MNRNVAPTLAARLRDLLDKGMAPQIVLTREEALLAQVFAESVAELLTPAP